MKLSERKRYRFKLDKLNASIQKENREKELNGLPYQQINPEWSVRLNGQYCYELNDAECGLVALEMVETVIDTPFGKQSTSREGPVPYTLRKEWCEPVRGFYNVK